MCGIIITNINNFDLNHINFFNKKRGPDLTNHKIIKKGLIPLKYKLIL